VPSRKGGERRGHPVADWNQPSSAWSCIPAALVRLAFYGKVVAEEPPLQQPRWERLVPSPQKCDRTGWDSGSVSYDRRIVSNTRRSAVASRRPAQVVTSLLAPKQLVPYHLIHNRHLGPQ